MAVYIFYSYLISLINQLYSIVSSQLL